MRLQYLFLFSVLLPLAANAQFSKQGIIYYERDINLKLQVQLEDDNSWAKNYIKQMEGGAKSTFRLAYAGNISNYVFSSEEELKPPGSWLLNTSLAYKNHIWTDYENRKNLAQKQVYEKTYLLNDSLSPVEWKLSDEIRVIAGYTCRKAVTTIFDSVVVVAFYTDQIMVSGGPESFHGLPGMILAVAIPRLYTTWFATKVELRVPEKEELIPPTEGEPVNRKELEKILEKVIRNWRGSGQKMLWKVFL